jgi:dolichol-phosphate mannosyltransferase
MSGFFLISRQYFEKVMYNVTGKGFKILLDMLASGKDQAKVAEVPYTMRSRKHGQSKLDLLVVWDFLILVLDRFLGNILPYRFVSFVTVGFTGLFVHLLVLWILHDLSSLGFTLSQTVATFTAMTSNYILNNRFTYYDNRKTGRYFWRGLLGFYLVCMLGAVLNVALATELYQRQIPWLLAGMFGALGGAIWNFTVSGIFVWGRARWASD